MAVHKSWQSEAALPYSTTNPTATPSPPSSNLSDERLAAGVGWQLLIAVVEALVEARLWKLKAL